MLPIPAGVFYRHRERAEEDIERAKYLSPLPRTQSSPTKNPTKTLNPDHNVCAVDNPHFCTATIATVPFITQTEALEDASSLSLSLSMPNISGRKDVRKHAKDL